MTLRFSCQASHDITLLAERLVRNLLLADANADVSFETNFALRVFSSYLSSSNIVEDESLTLGALERFLARHNPPRDLVKFQILFEKLCSTKFLENRSSILSLLEILSRRGSLVAKKPIFRSLFDFGSSKTPEELCSNRNPSGSVPSFVHIEGAGIRDSSSESTQELPERFLVRDVLYILQGIDGKDIKFTARGEDSYSLHVSDSIRTPLARLLARMCQSGKNFKELNFYIDDVTRCPEAGLVAQGMFAAVKSETAQYHRHVVSLEGMRGAEGQGLSLRQMAAWLQEPAFKLRHLVEWCRLSRGQRGGALLSLLSNFLSHGDPVVVSMAKNILLQAARPFYYMIGQWIHEGVLDDPFNEFFVCADQKIDYTDEKMWNEKYTLIKEMVPRFLVSEVALKDWQNSELYPEQLWIQRPAARPFCLDLGCEEALRGVLHRTNAITSRQLLDLLFKKFKLLSHFQVLYDCILLGSGDFAHNLLDVAFELLERPAQHLYRHSLLSCVDTALRSSVCLMDDISLECLDALLLHPLDGACGWDIFVLSYRSRCPLNIIFTAQRVEAYNRIFKFLWHFRRLDYCLKSRWALSSVYSRRNAHIDGLDPLLKFCSLQRSEMQHMVREIQYYVSFEVVQPVWRTLSVTIRNAVDLDAIILAHSNFLDSVLSRCFLRPESAGIFQLLEKISSLVLEFTYLLASTFKAIDDEVMRRRRLANQIRMKTLKNEWGMTKQDELESREMGRKFAINCVQPLERQSKELAVRWKAAMGALFSELGASKDTNLKVLSFRLDFNNYYKNEFN
ncbi:gamma-tubulin complex component 3-like isoform X2 [Zophobas morio]|uniref:gamma-tubulin complex component 3-like isoform X2 n=1 Tax=Zophobas morio TaxID=2755281 RepID=UPI003082B0D6